MSSLLPLPDTIGSLTSGMDGGSEGGRQSTGRLPTTLVLYAVPLIAQLRRQGYRGKLQARASAEPEGWVIKLIYDGEGPPDKVPQRWHGRQVVVEQAPPPPEQK
ncbi:MAG: hypothetical protein WAM30_10845 [Candidatus Dormiibacterota bacterium]